jgi:precorrin-8X/cobalt-precorrin-8 methylmutase
MPVSLFDDYIFGDWSASATPKRGKDSLWLCRARSARGGELACEIENPTTRADAFVRLRQWLLEAVARERRALVGLDFPYGLPSDSYALLVGPEGGWRDYWAALAARITDGPKNATNRFVVADALNRASGLREGPFWGTPPRAATDALRATKPRGGDGPSEFREVEAVLRAAGRRPFAVWQLLGNGSVGSQALVGLPMLHALTTDPELAPHSKVWPFEPVSLEAARRPLVIHTEVWPGAIEVDLTRHEIRDAAQMIALAEWAARADATGALARYFDAVRATPEREARARIEGWVLGVE